MVSVPPAPVPLRRRLAGIAPAVLVLAALWGCGGGGGGPLPLPETGPATESSGLPPGFPVNAYLWTDTFRPGSPVMEFGGSVHVGADVAPAADALVASGGRNGVTLSRGTVRDGMGAEDVVRYLRVAASHNLAAGRVTGLATFPETPVPTVILVAGKETRNNDTRFARLTAEAVRILNAALPFERQIRFSPHMVPEADGGAFLGRDLGEIWVQFIPKTHPVYPGDADPDELGRARVSYYVRDEAAETREVSEDGAGYSTVIVDSEAVASFTDPEVLHVLIHELLHAVGFVSHTDSREFDSTLSVGYFPGTRPRGLIHPIDREGLLAAYSRLEPGTAPEDISAETLGPWAETSFHLRGDLGIGAGEIAFGVAFRNGLAQPWAFGPKPESALGHNPALSGSAATWIGALLGITPSGRGVAGDSSLRLDMESLSGQLAFTGMRYDGGGTWGDGDLHYAVRAADNGFRRADAEFVRTGPGYDWSGKDLGTVTGAFFGARHEGMGGVLERHDLSAAFGGRR